MPIPEHEAREELRYALRRYLAARPTAALTPDMIRHGLRARGLDVSEAQILETLTFWMDTSPAQVMGHHREHGISKAYQISTAGVLADERGE